VRCGVRDRTAHANARSAPPCASEPVHMHKRPMATREGAADAYTSSVLPTHLFVICHGYMGFSGNVAVLAETIRKRCGPQVLVFVPTCFAVFNSADGIDVIARRVISAVQPIVAAHPSLTMLSLVGYSMGGLVCRYVAGSVMTEQPPFFGLTPVNYMTVACPHTGVRLLGDTSAGAHFLRALARCAGGRSAVQMLLTDHSTQLLALMCHPKSVFVRALGAFEHRVAYGCTRCDRTVPFWSSLFMPWEAGRPQEAPLLARGHEVHIDEHRYPHIFWEATLTPPAALAAKSEAGATAAATVGGDVSNAKVSAAAVVPSSDELSCMQLAALAVAAMTVLLPLVLPLVLTVIFPLLMLGRLASSLRKPVAPPIETELLTLDDGTRWSPSLLDREVEEGAASCPQEYMASQLNGALVWHKVAVRFSVALDGLKALHTHGHIVVRRHLGNAIGLDVLDHLVDGTRGRDRI